MIQLLFARLTTGKNAPLFQSLACLALCVLVSSIGYVAGAVGTNPLFPWIIFSAFLLFYAVYNSIISVNAKQILYYFQRSIFGFLLYILVGSTLSKVISGLGMSEAGSMRWLIVVFSISYLIFFVIMVLAKKIIEYAQRLN